MVIVREQGKRTKRTEEKTYRSAAPRVRVSTESHPISANVGRNKPDRTAVVVGDEVMVVTDVLHT